MLIASKLGRASHYLDVGGVSVLTRALFGKLTGKRGRVRVKPPAARLPVELRVPSSDFDAYRQVFLNLEYAFEHRPSPKVIVDAGSNIGLAAVYLANAYPDAKIFCIEPEPGNFEMLSRNVAPYPNVRAIRAALWREDGEIQLFDPGLGEWGYTTGRSTAGDGGRSHGSTRAMTMATLLRDEGIDRIDILKMDIEGAEYEVFENPSSWLSRVDGVIVELHDRLKAGCSERVYKALEGFPFRWGRGENHYFSRDSRFAGGQVAAP